jgi:hypothetical protein
MSPQAPPPTSTISDINSFHEMAIDVPENHPVIFTLETSRKSISQSENGSTKSNKSKTTIEIEEYEEKLDEHCCFGFINILTLLQIVTLANFIFDGICTYLSLHTLTTYLFALSATGSLLCLCAVISAVQEEKQKMLGTTSIWASLKLLVIGILYITATASMIEFYYSNDSFTIEPELIILFFFIPFCMLSLGLQWKLTVKVASIIRARDEFYTIPSTNCSVELRPSLRLYLAAQKLKDLQKF